MRHSLSVAGLLRTLAILSVMQITSSSLNAEKPVCEKLAVHHKLPATTHSCVESTLPYHTPPFDKIKDEHYVPAIEAWHARRAQGS